MEVNSVVEAASWWLDDAASPRLFINQDSSRVGPSALNISQPVSRRVPYPTKPRSIHAIKLPSEDGLEFIWLRHDLLDINRLAKNEMWMHISAETNLPHKKDGCGGSFCTVIWRRSLSPSFCHTVRELFHDCAKGDRREGRYLEAFLVVACDKRKRQISLFRLKL